MTPRARGHAAAARACAFLLQSLFAAACAAPLAADVPADAIVVRDALGRTVALPRAPERIVTIFSSNAEIVDALGLSDRIVGIDALTTFPEAVRRKPHVGGRLGFSPDLIVRQRPDLVIVTPARQALHQVLEPMARVGVPVLVLTGVTMNDVFANIRLVARATGVAARGETLASALEARVAAVRAAVAARTPPRVVMITGRLGNGLLLVARTDTYTGDAVTLAGGRFAIAGTPLVPHVSPEAVLAADPDVLLFAGSQADLDDLLSGPGWRNLRARGTGRVHTVPRGELLIPGPRTVDGIARLAALFHPGASLPK